MHCSNRLVYFLSANKPPLGLRSQPPSELLV
jgi:hypothetical protein